MTTAQDQQSRELLPCPFCGWTPMASNIHYSADSSTHCAVFCDCGAQGPTADIEHSHGSAERGWNRRAPVEQAARALPASMTPVAEIFAGDLFRVNQGPDAEPVTGDHDLYTAAQVLAMLAHRGHGEGANQPLTRMDAGAPPGRGLPPAGGRVDCIGLALELESQAKRVESQSVERAMSAAAQALRMLATTEPQAPTTGAGSVTAGAAPAYRLLQPGVDTIQATDEVLADDVVTWKAVGRGIFAGMPYIGAMLPVRRALKTGP